MDLSIVSLLAAALSMAMAVSFGVIADRARRVGKTGTQWASVAASIGLCASAAWVLYTLP